MEPFGSVTKLIGIQDKGRKRVATDSAFLSVGFSRVRHGNHNCPEFLLRAHGQESTVRGYPLYLCPEGSHP